MDKFLTPSSFLVLNEETNKKADTLIDSRWNLCFNWVNSVIERCLVEDDTLSIVFCGDDLVKRLGIPNTQYQIPNEYLEKRSIKRLVAELKNCGWNVEYRKKENKCLILPSSMKDNSNRTSPDKITFWQRIFGK